MAGMELSLHSKNTWLILLGYIYSACFLTFRGHIHALEDSGTAVFGEIIK